jgi:GT2 family glycosyltransferase
MLLITGSIVLYNNPASMIQKAIESFLNTSLDVKLYLIDNSPTDQLSVLSSLDKRIEYVHNPSNPGFGAAHNIALKKSITERSPYHLVLNPDVYFDHGVIEKIIEYMNLHTDVGLLMPKVLYPDGTIQRVAKLLPTPFDLFARRLLPLKGFIKKQNDSYELAFFNYDSVTEIPFITGCFMFLRTEVLETVGLFDEKIFMYLEDADLSRRISKVAKTVIFPEVSITHEYQRGLYKNRKLLLISLQSAWIYFNKYGWFFDSYRKKLNSKTLQALLKTAIP